MPSASAAQEEASTRGEIRCSSHFFGGKGFTGTHTKPCGKLILADGKFVCTRRGCGMEYSVAELQALRLLNGETTHAQFMREIETQLPLDQDPPAHDRAREIMGNNFISLTEALSAFRMSRQSPWAYMELLAIPFSDELLEEVRDTHLLMPFVSFSGSNSPPSRPTTLKDMHNNPAQLLCHRCPQHTQWKACAFNNQKTPGPQWLLIEKGTGELKNIKDMRRLPSHQTDYIPTAAEIIYTISLVQRTREGAALVRKSRIWCAPQTTYREDGVADLSFRGDASIIDHAVIVRCGDKLAIEMIPSSYSGRNCRLTAKRPDLNI